MGLFGKTPEKSPKDLVTEWTHKLRKESYALDRQVRGIMREEEKIKRSLKEAAKKGDKDVCIILAKEIIKAKKAIAKIHTTKAHLNSVQLQMKNQLAKVKISGHMESSTEIMSEMSYLVRVPEVKRIASQLTKEMIKYGTECFLPKVREDVICIVERINNNKLCACMCVVATLRVSGSLQKSTEVMTAMQSVLRLSDVSDTMRELSQEMMKAGIIEEMLEETFEGMEDSEEMEEEAQEQVDNILWELTAGTLGKAPAAVTDKLPPSSVSEDAGTSYEENEEELENMRSRLDALRS